MRLHNKAVAATIAAATTVASGLLTAAALTPASATTPPSVVAVNIAGGKVVFSGSTSVPAGNVVFQVKSSKGDHTVQLAQLASGYSPSQAKKDINAAFNGNKAAIKRVDTKITWLGGVDAAPNHPNFFSIKLTPGSYLATDQDSNGITPFTVVSAASNYRTLYPNAYATTKDNLFHIHNNGLALPRSGWLEMHNNAQEPHMFVLQHVKQSTTNKEVRDYIASGSHNPPSWGLPEQADAGVISPGQTQVFSYHLPPGKYLVMCFWPSIDTGAPHFTMGMWKLVELS